MAIEFRPRAGVLVIEFSGLASTEDLRRLVEYTIELEAREPVSPDRLVDLSGVTELAFDFPSVEQLAQQRIARPPRNPIRSAVVAPRPVQYGVARMYQTLNTVPTVELRIFRERAAAEAWLGR